MDWDGSEIAFFLVGLMLGLLLALDGWWSPADDKRPAFRFAPRVKAVVYLVSGAFMTLVTQWGFLPERSRLITFYLAGAVPTAIVTVAGIGFAISRKAKAFEKENGKLPFMPAIDYLQHGYAHYRRTIEPVFQSSAESARRLVAAEIVTHQQRTRHLLSDFTSQITNCMAGVQGYREKLSQGIVHDHDRDQLINDILKSILAFFLKCRQDQDEEGLEISVNYMQAYERSRIPAELDRELLQQMRFAFDEPARYEYFLRLDYYQGETRPIVVLPVEPKGGRHSELKLLPGAPTALWREKRILIETNDVHFPNGIPLPVRQEIDEYFSSSQFLSFASLYVSRSGKPVGVVNIDTNKPFVFGETEESRREMTNLLSPLCLILGSVDA